MVKGIAQVILPARDLPLLARFYGEQLGLPQLAAAPGVSPEHWLCFAAGGVELVLQAGQAAAGRPAAPCIVFRVGDMETAREVLLARGVELGEVHAAQPGVQVCAGSDPEGNGFLLEARD